MLNPSLEDYTLTVPFGKHKGESITNLAKSDPSYLQWLLDNSYSAFVESHREDLEEALHNARSDRLHGVPAPELTAHQHDKVYGLLRAMEHANVVRLEGGAGYGKSYCTAALARALMAQGIEVTATAVSYVATQVLAQQLEPLGVECKTLARTMRLNKRWNDDKEEYVVSDDTVPALSLALRAGKALVVDECSMVNDQHAQLLYDAAAGSNRGKLILVGDPYQLPPVKQNTRAMLCNPWDRCSEELAIPMRYSMDSPLYRVEQIMRTHPQDMHTVRQCAEVNRVSSVVGAVDVYAAQYRDDPTALHRMLLFRRVDVVQCNRMIRDLLFGENSDLVEEGEQLMVLATTDTPYDAGHDDATRYYSGQTFKVREFSEKTYEIVIAGVTHCIPHFEVRFDGTQKPVRLMFAVTEYQADPTHLGGPAYTAAVKAAREYALELNPDEVDYANRWDLLRRLNGDFVKVAYCYATTVHRAQGQTCDYAYCAPRQLLGVGGLMGPALAYVATTRARKNLTLIG